MTAGSRRIHAIQAHYKRKWFYLYLYSGKGWLKKLIKIEAPSDRLMQKPKASNVSLRLLKVELPHVPAVALKKKSPSYS